MQDCVIEASTAREGFRASAVFIDEGGQLRAEGFAAVPGGPPVVFTGLPNAAGEWGAGAWVASGYCQVVLPREDCHSTSVICLNCAGSTPARRCDSRR